VPAEIALEGGESDCRNRLLHEMFLLIGLGERAGSGLPKIQQGRTDQGHNLTIYDSLQPYDQTVAELTWGALEKTTQKTTQKLTEKQQAILDHLRIDPYASRQLLVDNISNITEDGIKYNLKALQDKGLIKRIGPAKGGHWEIIE